MVLLPSSVALSCQPDSKVGTGNGDVFTGRGCDFQGVSKRVWCQPTPGWRLDETVTFSGTRQGLIGTVWATRCEPSAPAFPVIAAWPDVHAMSAILTPV